MMIKWPKKLLILLLVFILLVCLLLTAATLADYRPDAKENAVVQGKAPEIQPADSIFTITTWNLGYFGLGKDCDFFYDGGRMTRPEKMDYLYYAAKATEYLAGSEHTDFYFFQEVDVKARRSYHDDQATRLRQIFSGMESSFAMNYLASFVPLPLRNPMGQVKSGIQIFSSFHSTENTRYAFPGGYRWPVNIFQLDRCFILSRLPLPGGKQLVLINTHNEAFDDGSQRKLQLSMLKDIMLQEYENGNYVVTGGDWNQNPVGFRDLGIGGLGDLGIGGFMNGDLGRVIWPAIEVDFMPGDWQWLFDPEVPTNRDVNQPYQKGTTRTTIIDFFVVSPNISVLEIMTKDLGFAWSDHNPVRMTFKFK